MICFTGLFVLFRWGVMQGEDWGQEDGDRGVGEGKLGRLEGERGVEGRNADED